MNMSVKTIQIQRVESLNNPVQEAEARIREKAYSRFVERGSQPGNDLDDWYAAVAEVIEQPALTLTETDNQVTAQVAVGGIDVKDLEVLVAQQSMLIRNGSQNPRQIFRVVELPKPIDAESVRAEYNKGTLRVTATLPSAAASYQTQALSA
jgi:HSP20 family molecular chaperone IbpA